MSEPETPAEEASAQPLAWQLPVRLIERHGQPRGRALLATLAGYFCSLASFEWSLLWDFSPYLFRPVVALLLSVGFVVTLALHQLERTRRSAMVVVALAWLALSAWPLRLEAIPASLLFSTLALLLLTTVASPARAGLGLVVALVLSLSLLAGVALWPVAVLACVAACLEAWELGRSRVASTPPAGRRFPTPDPDSRTVEISWQGFAALFKAAAPGEGERFTSTLLADSSQVIASCGGQRIKGSDLNGVYRFANEAALERCLDGLERYHRSVREVLQAAEAPSLELIVTRR